VIAGVPADFQLGLLNVYIVFAVQKYLPCTLQHISSICPANLSASGNNKIYDDAQVKLLMPDVSAQINSAIMRYFIGLPTQ